MTTRQAAPHPLGTATQTEPAVRNRATPRRTAELVAAVGLGQELGTRVGGLSAGQRRRLAVALGVQGRPELVLLDEPTTGMDPVARRQFWELIRGLRADGTTVLLTTHYVDEVAELADRVGVVAEGRSVESRRRRRSVRSCAGRRSFAGWTTAPHARCAPMRPRPSTSSS